MTVLEMNVQEWLWSQDTSETEISQDRLNITDLAQGKAWTTSVSSDKAIPSGLNYYEVKIITCNTSNSIKIVFGIMDKNYLNKILKINRGVMGSLRGGCPFGYFKEFGTGSLCYFANGAIQKDGIQIFKAEPLSTNDYIGVLYDSESSSLAFFKNKKHQVTVTCDFKDEIYLAASLIKQNSIGIVEKPELPNFDFKDPTTHNPLSLQLQQSPQQVNTVTDKGNSHTQTSTSPQSVNNTTTTTTTTTNTSNTVQHNTQPHLSNIYKIINNPTSQTTTTTTTNNCNTNIDSSNSSSNNPPTSAPNTCPICFINLSVFGSDLNTLNQHIDECLTLSLLDNEHGHKVYKIDCPYISCKKQILSNDFVSHCNETHFLENHHEYKCPLCKEKSKNLISHLSKSHIPLPSMKKQSFIGLGYSTSILDHDLDTSNECAICLEEFLKGQEIARLECLCVFHIQCMDFFLKTKKCPVHH